jgi:hypothetical protein
MERRVIAESQRRVLPESKMADGHASRRGAPARLERRANTRCSLSLRLIPLGRRVFHSCPLGAIFAPTLHPHHLLCLTALGSARVWSRGKRFHPTNAARQFDIIARRTCSVCLLSQTNSPSRVISPPPRPDDTGMFPVLTHISHSFSTNPLPKDGVLAACTVGRMRRVNAAKCITFSI